ncbi:MAG: ankyrin repeat domain-containing protein [Betaproteobacteria bacterium]|nr:ankyrin repeat domain-containing protein [Betaproteobacteria bacterium]
MTRNARAAAPDLQHLERIARGRTDLVLDWLEQGGAPAADSQGASLAQWCAYYGDVSALRVLVSNGVSLKSLGANLGLHGAAFHGHWRLCEFLLEHGARANAALRDTGETPLHNALCNGDRVTWDLVVQVLLNAGADPNARTKKGKPTGAFMRDARTRGETPLHRAAACGTESTLQMLLDAGADKTLRDAHGDSALAWASWHRRPAGVLRLLCFGPHRIHPDYGAGLAANRLGTPRAV